MNAIHPSAGDVVLRLRAITKRFSALLANDAIDLELRCGEVVALLGENGAGKTTLMSILFGQYVADAGSVETWRDGVLQPLRPGSPRAALRAGIGMVHQHFTLADNLSVLDNLILGTEPIFRPWQDRSSARSRLRALIDTTGLAVDLDARTGDLSIGERQRVEILKVLYRGARVLVLDEPTAVLTPQEAAGLFVTLRRLNQHGVAIIFISHKLDEVMALAHRVAVLRAGRKVLEVEIADADPSSLAMAMVGRQVEPPQREPLPPGAVVLKLAGVAVRPAGRTALEEASLVVREREIVGIAGVSGNGQQALIAALCGLADRIEGDVQLLGQSWPSTPVTLTQAKVGRIPEDRYGQGAVGDMSIAENLMLETWRAPAAQRFGLMHRARIAENAARLMAAFDVRGGEPATTIRRLSGGNMQKVILARVLDRQPRLIIAAQPTRGLDVGAVAFVHEQLLAARRRGAAILLISEELDELLALADRIAVIFRGRLGPAKVVQELDLETLGLAMAGKVKDAARAA